MMKTHALAACLVLVTGVAACSSIPSGPSYMALPGTGKNLDQFRADDAACRQYALEQSGALTAQKSGAAGASAFTLQRRYDDAYTPCMYSRGHRVAIPGGAPYTPAAPPSTAPAPPAPGSGPPPAPTVVH